ncbi:MAG: hypothetical protein AAFQ78_02545, partial [Bacteroidota bacterium]
MLPATQSHFSMVISTLANGVGFFGTHVLQHGGFAVVRRTPEDVQEELWTPQKKTLQNFLSSLVPTPQRIVAYSQKQVQRYGAPYILFGIFCCVNYTLPYFMWSHDSLQHYHLITYLRLLGGVMAALLIVKEKWSKALLPYFPSFWHLTLLYCLPFTSTVMFLLTEGGTEWLINIAINIMLLIVLVDWATFVLLSVMGIALGFLFYRLAVGPISLQLDFSTGYLLLYQGIFGTIIGLLFARRKQRRVDELANENEALTANEATLREQYLETYRDKVRIIQSLGHAGTHDMLKLVEMLKEMREKLRDDNAAAATGIAQSLERELIPMALQLRGLGGKASNYLRLTVAPCKLWDLLEAVRVALVQKGIKNTRLQLSTQHKTLTCDAKRLQTMLVNAVTDLHAKFPDQTLLIGAEDTELHYPLSTIGPNYIKKIAALRLTMIRGYRLPALQESYLVQLDGTAIRELPDTTQAVNLLENERIIKAHYGYSGQQEGTLYYVVPVALREVRPKDLDKNYMELGAVPVRADDSEREYIKLERQFFMKASKRLGPGTDIETLERVIELIKWYHGPVKRRSGEPFY